MSEGPFLDLRHLNMIRAIARYGRVADAADALGVTSSALSHRIREAERRLGLVLFTRVHKRLRMTPAAEYLAEVADRVLSDLDRAEQDVRRMDRGVQHVVRVALEVYGTYHWLPGFVDHLSQHLPGTEVQVMSSVIGDPVRVLANRQADIIIGSGENHPNNIHKVQLFQDELIFIFPPNHRLAGRTYVEGCDIEGEDFITFALTPAPDREFAQLFRPSERYPRWMTPVETPEAIVELVAAGQGCSVLAGWAVRPAIKAGRVAGVQVGQGGLQVSWCALMRSEDKGNGPIPKVAKALAEWASLNGGFD